MMDNNPKWYCMICDSQSKKPMYINIFDYLDVRMLLKQNFETFEDLYDYVKSELMDKFWSRSQFELNVSYKFAGSELHKIDVYDQIQPNLCILVNYINNTFDLGLEPVNLYERSFNIPFMNAR